MLIIFLEPGNLQLWDLQAIAEGGITLMGLQRSHIGKYCVFTRGQGSKFK